MSNAPNIQVSDNGDVYLNDYRNNTIWKNGKVHIKGQVMRVSGNDLYVANNNEVWKNNNLLYTLDVSIDAMCVSGGTVYAVGAHNGQSYICINNEKTAIGRSLQDVSIFVAPKVK
jgi:hypothetical protein